MASLVLDLGRFLRIELALAHLLLAWRGCLLLVLGYLMPFLLKLVWLYRLGFLLSGLGDFLSSLLAMPRGQSLAEDRERMPFHGTSLWLLQIHGPFSGFQTR